jgi:glucose-1-phosphate cytidylyltransferase
MTGGRVKRIQDYIGNEPFLLTYGDGVGDINIADTIRFHKEKGAFMTVTAYKPKGKFGAMDISENGIVKTFQEKPAGDGAWINAGFFVCQPQIFDYIKQGDYTILEREPMEELAKDGKMASYKHEGFWKPMDTLRDNTELNDMWDTNSAPWKTWD